MTLPPVVIAYLAQRMIAQRSLAYLQITTAGRCLSAAGELEKYGLSNIATGVETGEEVCDRLPFLEAFLPLCNRSEILPQVHLSPDLIIDAHLIPNQLTHQFAPQRVFNKPLDGGWLLLLDTTAETRKLQQLQQRGNELSLIRYQENKRKQNKRKQNKCEETIERLHSPQRTLSQATVYRFSLASQMTFNREDGPLLSNILSSLNLLILECQDPTQHQLRVVGQRPRWAACFEWLSTDSAVSAHFSPFLDNFLYDAQTYWQGSSAEQSHSDDRSVSQSFSHSGIHSGIHWGVWTESISSGEEIQLEAISLSINNRNIILVEQLNANLSERFQWLQTARQEQLNFIAEQKESERQIRAATSYDSLTGLPNRSLFLSELETFFEASQRSSSHQFALVVLNLNRFQLLNNSLGSEVGDQVLIAVADRIRDALRSFDVPVRFSSDEFGILLGHVDDEAQAIAIAQRLLERINQPFVINGTKTYFTASAGVAISAPWYRHSRDLLRDANLAMQEAKRQHRGRYVVFKRDMRIRAFELWSLESALDTAVEKGELALFYQPIVSLSRNTVEGFEALIRWNHPQKGQVSPAQFISLAEESGHILAIDNWVLQEACRTIQRWQQQTGHSAYLNINISPQHFEQGNLFETVRTAMQQAHIPPGSICLEITESCLLSDTQTVITTLNQLKALDVQIAIDDFGTGYASLSYLQDLPLDKLKIDGYFVEMMKGNGSDIVNTIIELAHRLNFNVTAERLETIEQYRTLKQIGCDMGQGYLFSKPLPPEEARSFINAQVIVSR